MNKALVGLCIVLAFGALGCSRQQSDWEKTRAANTTDSYEQFLKRYPNGEFSAQAQARVKELYEERDWQKARDADTQEAYQAFLKQYPEGKWTEEARIRVENFNLQAPANATSGSSDAANNAGNAAPADAAASSPPPPAPMAASAGKTPAEKPAKSATAGAYGIQLGAFKSGTDAANERWSRLEKEHATLLDGLSSSVSPKKSAAGTLYRLQVTGLTEKRALAICKSLKAKSQPCVLIRPAHPAV